MVKFTLALINGRIWHCVFQNLSERNKRYRSQIEQQEASRREQQRIFKKVHETQLAEKDELIRNIQDLLAGHEAKLEQQDKQLQGELTETAVAYHFGGSAIILLEKGKIHLVEEMWWNHKF